MFVELILTLVLLVMPISIWAITSHIASIKDSARATAEAKRKDLIDAAIEKAVKTERRRAEDTCRAYEKKLETLQAQEARLTGKEHELDRKLQETGAEKEQRIKELEGENSKLQSENETLHQQIERLSHIQFDDFPMSVPKAHTPPPPRPAAAHDQVEIDKIRQESYNEGFNEGKRVAENDALIRLQREKAAILQQAADAWQLGYNEGLRAVAAKAKEADDRMVLSSAIEQSAHAFVQQMSQELNQIQQTYEAEATKYRELTSPIMADFLSSPFLKGKEKQRYLEAFADIRGVRALLHSMDFTYPDAFPCTVYSHQTKTIHHTSLTSCDCNYHLKRTDRPVCKHMVALAIRLHAVPFDKSTFVKGITQEVAKKIQKELENEKSSTRT